MTPSSPINTKEEISIAPNKRIPIQASMLLAHNLTLKDIKAQMLLTLALRFLDDYFLSLDKNENELFGIYEVSPTSKDTIFEVANTLRTYLGENIIRRETLSNIIKNANKSHQHLLLAKQYEIHGVFHDYIANSFTKFIKKGSPWVPELLAFTLINTYKVQNVKPFLKHPFIEEFDFSKVLSIYEDLNIELKKQQQKDTPTKKIWEIRTVIDAMIEGAELIIKEYLPKQYKVNTNRISKTRKKK